MKGILKWYNRVKGYGFVMESGRDLFFHHTGVAMEKKALETLETHQGEGVEFEEEVSNRGPKAVQVRLLTNP